MLDGKPLTLPGRNILNLIAVLGALARRHVPEPACRLDALSMTAIALIFGAHLVMAIGGADMPVVVSMLNSYSGWAAAATGFLLGNDLLIVTGALVGASGAILSYIMCRAMNRNFLSVILGGWGTTVSSSQEVEVEIIATDVAIVAADMQDAQDIIIVPGYGMAVARRRARSRRSPAVLRAQGKSVRCHPSGGEPPSRPYERPSCRGQGPL